MPVMRALLVGAGAMGKAWARNLRSHSDLVELVGWVDIKPGLAAAVAEETEIPGLVTSEDLGWALNQVRPDFVVDVTVPEAHREVTVLALDAGYPVIGEKPMADSMEAAREMVFASERANKLYMVSQSRRYNPRLQAYRRLIEREVGPLGILNSNFYIGAHFGGFRDQMPSPLLLDMAIHTLDEARYISGQDAVSVYCEEFNPEWSWFDGDSSASAIFQMTNGLRYTYLGSWSSEGLHTSWESEWRAVGPKGSALWDGEEQIRAEVVVEKGGFHSRFEARTEELESGVAEGIAGSLRDFVHALKTGITPMGECHDNIKSLAMVFAAIESAQIGKRVRIEA